MISIAWRRKVLKEQMLVDLPLKGRERAIVNQTNIGTVSWHLGETAGWSAYVLFRAHKCLLEPN